MSDPVRGYVLTGGRAPSRNTVRPETLLVAVPNRVLPVSASWRDHAIVELGLRGPVALAELAAHLKLPISVMAVLVSDLIDNGSLVQRRSAESPPPSSDSGAEPVSVPSQEFMERVLAGLRDL